MLMPRLTVSKPLPRRWVDPVTSITFSIKTTECFVSLFHRRKRCLSVTVDDQEKEKMHTTGFIREGIKEKCLGTVLEISPCYLPPVWAVRPAFRFTPYLIFITFLIFNVLMLTQWGAVVLNQKIQRTGLRNIFI